MIKLYPASYDDFEAIANLHATSWQQNYRGMVADHYLDHDITKERFDVWQQRFANPAANQYVIVAKDDEKLAGFICVYGGKDSEFGSVIDNLHVAKAYAGQGLGQQLIAAAMQWLNQHYPKQGVYLEVLAKNKKAIGFYDAMGGTKAKENVWIAPCSTPVDEYIYAWPSPDFFSRCLPKLL